MARHKADKAEWILGSSLLLATAALTGCAYDATTADDEAIASSALLQPPAEPPDRASCSWSQWGQNASHAGQTCLFGQEPLREQAHLIYDPFQNLEIEDAGGALLVHYQVPLTSGNDLFMLQKKGTYVPCDPPGSGEPF